MNVTSEFRMDSHADTSPYVLYVNILLRVANPILITLGVVGNTLSFVIMNQPSNRNNIMCFHLKVLSVSDTFVLVLYLLPKLIININPDVLRFSIVGEVNCQLYAAVLYLYNISIWQILIIAFDRFIVVAFPLKAALSCTMRKAKIQCAVNVIAHLVIYFPNSFWTAKQGDDGLYSLCVFPSYFDWFGVGFEVMNACVDVFLPLTLLFILNIAIIFSLKRQSSEVKEQALGGVKTRQKQERSMTVMLIVVATSLMIFLLPYTVDFIAWHCCLEHIIVSEPNLRIFTFELGFILGVVNNASNFFLYLASSSKFRSDIKRLILCKGTN